MEDILQAAFQGLMLVLSWPNVLYTVAGTLLAMAVAAIPGIGTISLISIAIPFTFGWEPLPIMLFFGALVGGGTFMGSISAILMGIPGTAPNAATVLDGYPMALKGQAGTAIGCSAAASALGSSLGVLVLILLMPVLRHSILAFGPAEFLMLTVWGLITIAAVSKGSLVKGLGVAGLGLLLSLIGFDGRTAETRYTFGTLYLHDGLPLIPVFVGIFALAEALHLTVQQRPSISGGRSSADLSGRVGEGIQAVFRNFWLFLRSSIIGVLVGVIPGIGGTVAGFIAYGHAAQTAGERRDGFGQGDIRGVLAPEAANDAKDGASLVPTLAFGIPGSEGTALLLAVFTLHGIVPGAQLMSQNLPLAFVLIWALFLSNWLTSIIGVLLVKPFTWLTVVRLHWLAPLIFAVSALGAYLYRGRFLDVAVAFLLGVMGYYLKKYGWPRICLVVALVLGPLFETNLHLTLQLHRLGRQEFWTRPIALCLLVLSFVFLLYPFLRSGRGSPGNQ